MNMPLLVQDVHVTPLDMNDSHEVGRYNAFVQAHEDSTPYHLAQWGRAVEKALGHKACYLVAHRKRAIMGVLPLMEVHSWLFGRVMVSSSLAMRAGPLVQTDTARAALDQAAWDLAQKHRCKLLEYRAPSREDAQWHDMRGTYANFARPLADNMEDNLKAIPRKQRAEVRRSLDLGLSTSVGRDSGHLQQHYHIYATSVRNLGTPVLPRTLFKTIIKEYGEDADILTISKGDVPLASVLSLYHKDRVYPHYGGGVADARQWRANDHMYWQLMEHARARGMRIFDFGRSKYGTGAFDFKKNWGFTPEPLTYAVRLTDGQTPPDLNPNSPRYQLMTRTWKKLPLALANLMGPVISRHFY